MIFYAKGVRYRKDGLEWKRKKNGKGIAENHERLRIKGIEMLRCFYVHSLTTPTFHRRAYTLLSQSINSSSDKADEVTLVHYFDEAMHLNQSLLEIKQYV